MYSSRNENRLIVTDICSVLQDVVSIQVDIDETKVKAAALIAQDIDLKRIIGKDNIARCIEPDTGWPDTPEGVANKALQDLVIPAWCFYTYSRLLKGFQGTFTDSGHAIEKDSTDANVSKSMANEHHGIAEAYMQEVLELLEAEGTKDSKVDKKKLTPGIRVFGGKERRY